MTDKETIIAFLQSDDAKFILGIPCFRFIKEAELWRATGTDIPKKAEEEQAFFLGRLLELCAEHGSSWNLAFADECTERANRLAKERG